MTAASPANPLVYDPARTVVSDSESSAPTPRRARRARELTLHAILLAIFVWAAVAADVISPGKLGRYSGHQKGNDFVVFYVLGSLVKTGSFSTMADDAAFRRAQRPYLRDDARSSYPAIYGPQIGVLFLPFALVAYLTAYAVWSVVSLLLIAWAVRTFWRACDPLRPWPWAVAAAAAAFPPLGYLILAGQLSSIAVAALGILVIALRRESRVLAGVAVGILAYKASLFAPALAVCVLAGEWLIALVAVGVAAMQVFGVAPIVGLDVVLNYVRNSLSAAGNPDALVMRPFLTVSFRTFWAMLLPPTWAKVAYLITAAATVAVAARAWRRQTDPLQRAGILSLAIALAAAPHLFLYDLVILMPAFVASAGIFLVQRSRWLRRVVYLAYVSPFAVPVAAYTSVQLITIVLTAWLTMMAATGSPQRCD